MIFSLYKCVYWLLCWFWCCCCCCLYNFLSFVFLSMWRHNCGDFNKIKRVGFLCWQLIVKSGVTSVLFLDTQNTLNPGNRPYCTCFPPMVNITPIKKQTRPQFIRHIVNVTGTVVYCLHPGNRSDRASLSLLFSCIAACRK